MSDLLNLLGDDCQIILLISRIYLILTFCLIFYHIN